MDTFSAMFLYMFALNLKNIIVGIIIQFSEQERKQTDSVPLCPAERGAASEPRGSPCSTQNRDLKPARCVNPGESWGCLGRSALLQHRGASSCPSAASLFDCLCVQGSHSSRSLLVFSADLGEIAMN